MPEINKKKKAGKGIVFTDLIYIKGVKERLDKNGRKYQTFYFIIGQDMGFMSCSYYGSTQLLDGMCLKLLTGRFCPRRTQQGQVFLNFRVEKFELFQIPASTPTTQEQPVDEYAGLEEPTQTEQPKQESSELNWIDEPDDKPKDDGEELVDVKEVEF